MTHLSRKLHDVYAKLDWADKHIDDLRRRILTYFQSHPPAVSGELVFDLDRNRSDWSGVRFKAVDVAIPLTIGDAADNLRGALDYLASILVREAGNDPLALKPFFPILDRPPHDKSGPPKLPEVKGGVSDDALKLIDAVQPYKTPGWLDHPLLVVQHLANINKHQYVLTGTKEIGDVILTKPDVQLARYAVTLGPVRDDYAGLIFTLSGAPEVQETGATAYLWVEHAKNRPVAPIESLTLAAWFIREEVVGPIERICL